MKTKIKEATGNTEAVRSLKHFGWRAHKLSDVQGQRFTSEKPVDILACSPKGRYVPIEGKMIKKWGGFNGKKLRPNQIVELDGAVKNHARAFVFLYVRIPADKFMGTQSVTKLVVFDWKVHREQLMGKGYTVSQLREQSVGRWLSHFIIDKKIYWPLKDLLTRRN